MCGCRALADKTWAAYHSLPATVRACALNYCNCHCALPPAQQGFSGRFLYWFPVRTDWQAVLIIADELHPGLAAQFPSYREIGAVADPYAREYGTASCSACALRLR